MLVIVKAWLPLWFVQMNSMERVAAEVTKAHVHPSQAMAADVGSLPVRRNCPDVGAELLVVSKDCIFRNAHCGKSDYEYARSVHDELDNGCLMVEVVTSRSEQIEVLVACSVPRVKGGGSGKADVAAACLGMNGVVGADGRNSVLGPAKVAVA